MSPGILSVKRLPQRAEAQMLPRTIPQEPGLIVVDATWGAITPIELAPGVRTVGELEVIEHIRAGLPLIDTRRGSFYREGTIPGARNIPHQRMAADSIDSINRGTVTVFFCNGPQCAATPEAIHTLLEEGHPADSILFYRGGIHDWVTLGLPLEMPASHD
jgi:rhodanese-related sulfurtransferase